MRAFRLAYDGRGYAGFQRQPDVRTVEDALFEALRALDAYTPERADATPGDDRPDRPRGYAAAGRTDAGVSAIAQTVAFEGPDWLTPRALNAELPADVRAWASADVSVDFHATHDAAERTYTYHLYAPVGDVREPTESVDDNRVSEALETLSGTHDFHNLTPDDRNTERTLSLAADRDGTFLSLTVRAGGFPRQLVRRLVTLVRRVGTGEQSLESVDRALQPDPLPGHEGIPPAPPDGLILADVTYPDVEFTLDEDAASSARTVFARRRIDRATRSRVAGQLRDGIQ